MSEDVILHFADPLRVAMAPHWSPDATFFAVIISGIVSLFGLALSFYSIRNQKMVAKEGHRELEFGEFKKSIREKVSELVGSLGLFYSQLRSISSNEEISLISTIIECEAYIATLSRGKNSNLEFLMQAAAALRVDLSSLYHSVKEEHGGEAEFSFSKRKNEILEFVALAIAEERRLIFGNYSTQKN